MGCIVSKTKTERQREVGTKQEIASLLCTKHQFGPVINKKLNPVGFTTNSKIWRRTTSADNL